jgi:hypothetical protein
MNKLILTVLTLLTSATALAYGPPSKLLVRQTANCELKSATGETLEAKLVRSLWDIVRTPGTRRLVSDLQLADGTGFENGQGNLDKLLSPHFGNAAYDQSTVSVSVESVTGDASLELSPLVWFSNSKLHAWHASSQDDMVIRTSIDRELRTKVTFSAYSKSVTFEGVCIIQN